MSVESATAWAKRNPEKVRENAREYRRRWREKNPEKVREQNRLYNPRRDKKQRAARQRAKQHGLTVEQIERMTVAQGGVCAACGSPPPGVRPLAVDHCHETGLIRGLLCGPCNSALGLLKEDPLRMRALEAYIRQFNWIKA